MYTTSFVLLLMGSLYSSARTADSIVNRRPTARWEGILWSFLTANAFTAGLLLAGVVKVGQ